MIIGVRYIFPEGLIVEFTYFYGCVGNPERWAANHIRSKGTATVERFESDVPVHRRTEPDGTIKDSPVPRMRAINPKDWSPHWGPEFTE